ncbi:MAG: hypothetical protein BHV77_16185 [Bacteroides sp. 43_108]|nr:MAG: hypothetical protein BHV77_16185 [Bacteroides sp. 43_108]
MNAISIFILKVLRKVYTKVFGTYQFPALQREDDPDKASEIIYNLLASDKPCMIARFGSTEMSAIINYLGVNSKKHSILDFIKGKQPEWWWNKNIMKQMQQWSGFFPPTPENIQRFGQMMIEDAKEVDVLGSWLNDEYRFYYNSNISAVKLVLLEPYHSNLPWSRILMNKKVLVIHPFADLIYKQYQKRKLLFKNQNVLPDFELETIQAVQSLGGESGSFKTWFDALNWMEDEMDKRDYDICLIGCGAYGFPLAAHAKRKGKKAVHLGGALQLLFGIKGKRWELDYYPKIWGLPYDAYSSLFNEYWVRPSKSETPSVASNVEGGCYW